MDTGVYTWFLQKWASGQLMSGPLLCENTLEFNQKHGEDSSFVASAGCFCKFNWLWHGIRELEF